MMKDLAYNTLVPQDDRYPDVMRDLFGHFDTPNIHYIGNIDLLGIPSVGFCGSRNASEKGLDVAFDCASQFAASNVCVVSGYAKGVDTQAHRGAIENSGYTVIVLPEGIKNFRIKKELSEHWNWERILVLSYFQPDAVWRADRAMDRNRMIVGISDATIVIEARESGGTFHAGMTALNQKKLLIVAKYFDTNISNVGNERLIELGGVPLQRNKNTGLSEIRWIVSSISKDNPN
ncbi:DNA-processing protein DprA [Mesorhizobium sp. CO1-1-8]|uniref:DNA-processing protein DprA n=1 Tax=Mesorhizobium sp. CO1-1-8 TaxID=2876631 RepID=UPI001CD165DD|nr:DNA-processing protein DprA [Mesorhizobium sp. CO1-1-8]MBZ9772977.1 DNA-protecting protein DprA [Mesorhizobium sp. CO1-1-8]